MNIIKPKKRNTIPCMIMNIIEYIIYNIENTFVYLAFTFDVI